MEAQLLGIVVKKESPELEKQKDDLVLKIAAGKKKLVELEDEILRYVAQGHVSPTISSVWAAYHCPVITDI
mgnify:CR=1